MIRQIEREICCSCQQVQGAIHLPIGSVLGQDSGTPGDAWLEFCISRVQAWTTSQSGRKGVSFALSKTEPKSHPRRAFNQHSARTPSMSNICHVVKLLDLLTNSTVIDRSSAKAGPAGDRRSGSNTRQRAHRLLTGLTA